MSRLRAVFFEEGIKAAINNSRYLTKSQFAKCDQIAGAKKVRQRALGAIHRVNVAALHALLQCLRREIRKNNFIDALHDPVGYSFAYLDTGDLLDGRPHAFNVLDVHGGEYVNLGVEQLDDILVTLGMFTALDVGVGKFVDYRDGGLAGDDRVDIHLYEDRAFVFEFARSDAVELTSKFCGG